MKGCLRSCFGTVGLAVVLVGAAYGGWKWGPAVFPRLESWLGETAAEEVRPGGPSPEIAESTRDRVEAFLAGDGAEPRLELDGTELSSVIRYALPGIIPPGVELPMVELEDGKVFLSARVARAAFPDLSALGEIAGLLPDTVDIRMRGALVPFSAGVSALHVERVEAERIPLPARVIPAILAALGRKGRDGLPAEAMAIPLPSGLDRAFVEGDRLILLSDR
jgi:hypothetical protein